jgi:hypothetical protein
MVSILRNLSSKIHGMGQLRSSEPACGGVYGRTTSAAACGYRHMVKTKPLSYLNPLFDIAYLICCTK